MLDCYNDDWRESSDEDLPVLTEENFISQIALEQVCISPEGYVLFYWNDGPLELFGCHCIEIAIKSDGNVDGVALAG